MCTSQEEVFSDFNNTEALFWFHRDLVYGDWNTGRVEMAATSTVWRWTSQKVQQNGSLYIHVYFTKSGFHPDPKRKGSIADWQQFMQHERAESHGPVEIISHWHPNLTINMVDDHTAWVKGSVPPPLDQHVKFDAVSGDYYPIVYFNDYWNLQRDYYPINETLTKLPLRLTYCPLSLWRWQLYAAQNARSPWNFLPEDTYEQSDEDQDSVKVALLETNPYLLGLTIIVSIVHSIFEFLAFKNVSGVLLYILDNETNFVVQVSVFIGLLIDLWKITKVMDVRREQNCRDIPTIGVHRQVTYVESSTKIYDDMAFKYLSWLLYPLFGCYAVYSLLYVEHKGWYSWVLSMLYGFLFHYNDATAIHHYKMKSVAHLPWRMLTYKALNTFIDDLFAFVIKMPMMYRIGCLRDDVVFFIYLYQRWIYRVDPNRVNEFGTSGLDHDQNNTANAAPAAAAAITDKPEEKKKND
ncbi:hypothetical protein INR49_022143 [Caranx melampygus]|nr:hypothetical protein INR49_022143 [Caranx melampygus]